MTLRDKYSANPKYPWGHFLDAASHLVSEGLLQGKGDGFVVHYSLTSKGRNAVLASNGGKAVDGTP